MQYVSRATQPGIATNVVATNIVATKATIRSAVIAPGDGDFGDDNLMQLKYEVQGWYGRGASNRYLRSRSHELTVLHCHGGPPDCRAAKTLYDLLGASPHDDAERLKEAFRRAVRANHPDLHPSDPDATVRLSGIVRAYEILRDAHERVSYDRALDLEPESLGSEPRLTNFGTMHRFFTEAGRAATEAGRVAALAVTLSVGYALVANGFSQITDDRTVQEVSEPVTVPTVELAGQGGSPTASCATHEGTPFNRLCYERAGGRDTTGAFVGPVVATERIPSGARLRRATVQAAGHAHAAVLRTPRQRALLPAFQWKWPSFHWGPTRFAAVPFKR